MAILAGYMKPLAASSLVLLLAAVGCSKKDDGAKPADPPAPAVKEVPAAGQPPTVAADPGEKPVAPAEPAATEPPILKLVGFPNVKPDSEAGQYAFAPNDSTLVSAVEGTDNEKRRLSYGIYKIVEPGPVETKVSWMSSEWMVPNALITPIPKGVEVAVGDLVASSRYGNAYDHALVTKAGSPPTANFMGTMPYGKDYNAELKPDQYIKLDGSEWQPGSIIAYKTADTLGWEAGFVLRSVGDKLLIHGHMGKLATADKSEARPVPLKPEVKKGDTVFAVWDTVHFSEATIVKVDDKLGLYQIKMGPPFDKDVRHTPYGMLMPQVLPE